MRLTRAGTRGERQQQLTTLTSYPGGNFSQVIITKSTNPSCPSGKSRRVTTTKKQQIRPTQAGSFTFRHQNVTKSLFLLRKEMQKARLEDSLGVSGRLWAPLGHFLGMSWALFDVSCAALGVLGRLWRDFGASGKVSAGVQEGFAGRLGMQICVIWGALAHPVCLLLR